MSLQVNRKDENIQVKLNPNAEAFNPTHFHVPNASADSFVSRGNAPLLPSVDHPARPLSYDVPLLSGFRLPRNHPRPHAFPLPAPEQPPHPHLYIPQTPPMGRQPQPQFCEMPCDYMGPHNNALPAGPRQFNEAFIPPNHSTNPWVKALSFTPPVPYPSHTHPLPSKGEFNPSIPGSVLPPQPPFPNFTSMENGQRPQTGASIAGIPPFDPAPSHPAEEQPPNPIVDGANPPPTPPPAATTTTIPTAKIDLAPPLSKNALNTAAPAYVPSSWTPPHPKGDSLKEPKEPLEVKSPAKVAPLSENSAAAVKLSPENPLVVLVYGCRGGGKSTQSQILAERYHLLWVSSGNLFREGKKPFRELERIVQEQFGPQGLRAYNGLVLDRFIVKSEVDAYYIESILREANLPTPLVFWLQVDPRVGMARAESRGEVKPALEQWRHIEKVAHEAAAEKVYRPCGRLVEVNCNTLDKEAASQVIIDAVERFIRDPNRNAVTLPVLSVASANIALPPIVKYTVVEQLKKAIHVAVGNSAGRTDSSPLCSIGGYVDREFFKNARRNRSFVAHFMNVTLKVDGQRYLVARHREYGFVGFPFIFNCCYNFNNLFVGLELPQNFVGDSPIDVILDAELQVDYQGNTMLHIIDFIYFHGHQAKSISFLDRYQMLKKWIPKSHHYPTNMESPPHFCLKQYVPINKLHTILKKIDEAPFAIDGIVFQHNEVYRFGMDRYMLKWKPQELCTADFRLDRGLRSENGLMRQFQLRVTDSNSKNPESWEEMLFPGAVAVFTSKEVLENHLSEGKIVELCLQKIQKESIVTQDSQSVHCTLWAFHRVREDKPAPNKFSMVKQIVQLSHLTYEELLRETSLVSYVGPLKKLDDTDSREDLNSAAHKPMNDVSK
ncbi:unnamed protein product [Phytomonas sp. EM1]|nr:unnamed protein product [Phytomonas sp. EM1]|eukprot:CCW62792.1 unnamed protein product [Phytomonas sp. isolate EM1]